MNNLKEALKLIVRNIRRTVKFAELFASDQADGHMNVFDDIYGELLDSLYYLCNQKTDTLSESIVYTLIKDDSLTDDAVAEKLSALVTIQED